MKTTTKYFGEINYEEADILHIPEGLFGFEDQKKYLLIHFTDDDASLLCLQSLLEESLTFVLMNPFFIEPNYHPQLVKEDMTALALAEDSAVTFYALCVIQDKLEDSTVNLKCPIAINPITRRGRQIILDDAGYKFKHPLQSTSVAQKEGEHC